MSVDETLRLNLACLRIRMELCSSIKTKKFPFDRHSRCPHDARKHFRQLLTITMETMLCSTLLLWLSEIAREKAPKTL